MSIWCSYPAIGDRDDDNGERNGASSGEVRSYATGWSNHYPTTDGSAEQPASVDIAHIPTWCVPGHQDEETGYDWPLGPWLRLGVYSKEHDWASGGKPTGRSETAMVVMDEAAVRSLVADLTAWLEKPKTYPVDAALPESSGGVGGAH